MMQGVGWSKNRRPVPEDGRHQRLLSSRPAHAAIRSDRSSRRDARTRSWPRASATRGSTRASTCATFRSAPTRPGCRGRPTGSPCPKTCRRRTTACAWRRTDASSSTTIRTTRGRMRSSSTSCDGCWRGSACGRRASSRIRPGCGTRPTSAARCASAPIPTASVLDPFCRAHDVENLFAVDASFFPSSAAVNPGLTIVAQALRVADHIRATDLR